MLRWETDGRKELNEWFQLKRGCASWRRCSCLLPPVLTKLFFFFSVFINTWEKRGSTPSLLRPAVFLLVNLKSTLSLALKNKLQQLCLKSAAFIWPLPGQSAPLRSKSCLRASFGWNGNIITLEEPAEPTPAQGETAAWGVDAFEDKGTFFFFLLNNRICSVFVAMMTPSVSHLQQHQSPEATKLLLQVETLCRTLLISKDRESEERSSACPVTQTASNCDGWPLLPHHYTVTCTCTWKLPKWYTHLCNQGLHVWGHEGDWRKQPDWKCRRIAASTEPTRIFSWPPFLPTRTLTDNQWTLKMYRRRHTTLSKRAVCFLKRLTCWQKSIWTIISHLLCHFFTN